MAKIPHILGQTPSSLSSTRYAGIGQGGLGWNFSEIGYTLAHDCTISDLDVLVSTASSGAGSVTLRKNGADTALTVTLTASTTGHYTDSTHSISCVAGDVLTFSCTKGGSGTLNVPLVRFLVEPTSGYFNLFTNSGGANLTSTGGGVAILGSGTKNVGATPDVSAYTIIPTAGTLQNMATEVTSNTSDGSVTYQSYINGALGNLTFTIGAGTTGTFLDSTNTDSISAGDSVSCDIAITGRTTGTVSANQLYSEFVTTDKASVFANNQWSSLVAGAAGYAPVAGSQAKPVFSEASVQMSTGVDGDISQLSLLVSSNSHDGATVFTLNVGGTGSALTISVPASTTGTFTDSTHTVSVLSTDLLSIYYDDSASTGGSFVMRAMSMKFLNNAPNYVTGTATFSPSASFSGVGASNAASALTISGSASLAAAGTGLVSGTATIGATASLSAVGAEAIAGSLTVSAAASLSAIGVTAIKGDFTISPAGTLSAGGSSLAKSTLTLAGSGSLSIEGAALADSTATWSSSASFSPVGKSLSNSSASWASSGSFAAYGQSIVNSSLSIASSASLSAIGGSAVNSTATLSASASLSGIGEAEGKATFGMAGAASFSVSGQAKATSSYSIAPAAESLFYGKSIVNASSSFNAQALFSADGRGLNLSTMTASASSSFAGAGVAAVIGAFSIDPAAVISFGGKRQLAIPSNRNLSAHNVKANMSAVEIKNNLTAHEVQGSMNASDIENNLSAHSIKGTI